MTVAKTRGFVFVMAVTACGGGSDGLTLEETRQAIMAYQLALSGAIELDVEVGGVADLAFRNGPDIEGSDACPGGGTFTFASSTSPDGTTYTDEASFDGCGVDGIVFTGQATVKEVSSDVDIKTTVVGDLSFSGKIDGDCAIDYGFTIDETFQFVLYGTYCGHDINDVLPQG
jgi:hypothetical protein